MAELLFGGFADLVEIDRLEAEGDAELVGLNGAWGESDDEFEGVRPLPRARLNGNRHHELVARTLPVRTPLHRRGAGSVI